MFVSTQLLLSWEHDADVHAASRTQVTIAPLMVPASASAVD